MDYLPIVKAIMSYDKLTLAERLDLPSQLKRLAKYVAAKTSMWPNYRPSETDYEDLGQEALCRLIRARQRGLTITSGYLSFAVSSVLEDYRRRRHVRRFEVPAPVGFELDEDEKDLEVPEAALGCASSDTEAFLAYLQIGAEKLVEEMRDRLDLNLAHNRDTFDLMMVVLNCALADPVGTPGDMFELAKSELRVRDSWDEVRFREAQKHLLKQRPLVQYLVAYEQSNPRRSHARHDTNPAWSAGVRSPTSTSTRRKARAAAQHRIDPKPGGPASGDGLSDGFQPEDT